MSRSSTEPGARPNDEVYTAAGPPLAMPVVGQLLDAAFRVHDTLAPGLAPDLYKACLCVELAERGVEYQRDVVPAMAYRGQELDTGIRVDLVLDDSIVVRVLVVEAVLPCHRAEVLTQAKLAGHRAGVILNFNVPKLTDGIHAVIV